MKNEKNLVALQQQAFEIACKNLGIDSHTVILSTKHDIRTGADRALYSQWYKDMVIKRTCMGCQSLDVTFYFDKDGHAAYAYYGQVTHFNGNDGTHLIEALTRAENMRYIMDDAMRLVRRVETHLSASELAAGFMSGIYSVFVKNQTEYDTFCHLLYECGILSQDELESYLEEGAYDPEYPLLYVDQSDFEYDSKRIGTYRFGNWPSSACTHDATLVRYEYLSDTVKKIKKGATGNGNR